MKKGRTIQKVKAVIAGLIGGGLALTAALAMEGILEKFDFFSSKLTTSAELITPAFTEEFFKILLSVILFQRLNKWGIGAVGIGFGLLESAFSGQVLIGKPIVHLVFLLGGYWISEKIVKKRAGKTVHLLVWLAISSLMHWGYNSIILLLAK